MNILQLTTKLVEFHTKLIQTFDTNKYFSKPKKDPNLKGLRILARKLRVLIFQER